MVIKETRKIPDFFIAEMFLGYMNVELPFDVSSHDRSASVDRVSGVPRDPQGVAGMPCRDVARLAIAYAGWTQAAIHTTA